VNFSMKSGVFSVLVETDWGLTRDLLELLLMLSMEVSLSIS